MLGTRIATKEEAGEWLHSLSSGIAKEFLFGGDRWSCVDQAVLATIGHEVVGIATIAPRGEGGSGIPTIVGIYTLPQSRKQGVGLKLLEAALDHALSLGAENVHVDALHSSVLRMIERLPTEKQRKLSVADQSAGGALDTMLES